MWKRIKKILNYIICKILRIEIDDGKWKNLMQFVKFGIVGLSNTIVSYIIYVGALFLFQKNEIFIYSDYLIAQIVAFILSVLWSFYWNNKYVFEKKENEERGLVQALIKTYISYAFTGLFLNSALSILWVEIVHVPKLIAPIINLIINVPINYAMNKFWAFKTKKYQ